MIRITVVFLLAIPLCFGAKCSEYLSCELCDTARDEDGSQLCSWCSKSQSCVSNSGLGCVFGTKITDVFDCPLPVADNCEYDETFVKNYMLILSSAAYSDNPQQCLTRKIAGAVITRQVTVPCDSDEDNRCSGFAAVSTKLHAVMIAFRGSDGFTQLVLEAAESVFSHRTTLPVGGKVSKYFYDAFAAVWDNGLKDELVAISSHYPDYELWISGHSLGGSMASIAAHIIVTSGIWNADKIKFVSFGQPRTGNHEFAQLHDQNIKYTYRMTHRKDMVPHLPTKGYDDYHHHRYEVWYDNDMRAGDAYVVCLSPEDRDCSNSNLLDLSIDDHTHYFGYELSDWGISGCV